APRTTPSRNPRASARVILARPRRRYGEPCPTGGSEPGDPGTRIGSPDALGTLRSLSRPEDGPPLIRPARAAPGTATARWRLHAPAPRPDRRRLRVRRRRRPAGGPE